MFKRHIDYLVGCLLVLAMFGLLIPLQTMAAQSAGATSPAEAVEGFYQWLLTYIGEGEDFRNPVVDGAYHESAYLTAGLIARADEQVAAGLHADPFLCAQNVPAHIETEIVMAADDTATALVREYFGGVSEHNIQAELVADDGTWQIDRIICAETVTPSGVAEAFYGWYIDLAGYDEETGTRGSPLAEGAYHESPFLTADLVARLDEMVAGELRADPLLCAQDIPLAVRAYEAAVGAETARLLVHEHFQGNPDPYPIVVDLVRMDDRWLLSDVSCTVSPADAAGVVYAQYTMHVRYDLTYGIDYNWLENPAFRWDRYIDEPLLNELIAAHETPAEADPVLCAQDVPASLVITDLTVGEMAAEVAVIGLYPAGSDSFETYALATVGLSQVNGQWMLNTITCSSR